MSIWLTSDTHFGHPLLAAIRGFYNDTEAGRNAQSMHDSGATSSQIIEWAQQSHISMKEIADCDAHDRFVIDSINSCVSPGDELWHLGDVGFRCGIEHIRECMSQISVPVANRHLLIGNHDKCFRGNTKGNPADFDEVYLGMFSTVDEKVLIDNPLDGGKLLLCHFPWLESAGRDGYVRERYHAELGDFPSSCEDFCSSRDCSDSPLRAVVAGGEQPVPPCDTETARLTERNRIRL